MLDLGFLFDALGFRLSTFGDVVAFDVEILSAFGGVVVALGDKDLVGVVVDLVSVDFVFVFGWFKFGTMSSSDEVESYLTRRLFRNLS